ncbi:MAG TPA: hypothetical protein VIQ55_06075, partial [Burkholderiales bacterium]
AEPQGGALVDVSVADDGRLTLAFVCAHVEGELIGYAATADRHTYFRSRDGVLALVEPSTPDEALEEVAFGLVDEWLWYDEESAPVERARYADYRYPVRGVNVRSEKLAALRSSEMRFSSLDAEGRQARAALLAQWLKSR